MARATQLAGVRADAAEAELQAALSKEGPAAARGGAKGGKGGGGGGGKKDAKVRRG